MKTEVVRGSGNIYRDFDDPDADAKMFKALLATEIMKVMNKQGLSVRKAESLTGVPAADLSRIRNCDIERFTSDRLMGILNKFGSRIEVSIKVKQKKIA
jgi:predicted XRE-type DNA-binding protein